MRRRSRRSNRSWRRNRAWLTAREFLCNSHLGKARRWTISAGHEATRDWERAVELDDGGNKITFRLRMLRNKKDAAGCLAAAAENEAQELTDSCRAVRSGLQPGRLRGRDPRRSENSEG